MPTLVYDGDCGFCTRSAEFVSARSDVAVSPWQALDLDEVGLTEEQVTSAAYWLDGDGDVPRRGARAVAAALRACGPGYAVLGRAIDLPPVRPLAAAGYAVVARYRYRLPGGSDACRVPPGATPR